MRSGLIFFVTCGVTNTVTFAVLQYGSSTLGSPWWTGLPDLHLMRNYLKSHCQHLQCWRQQCTATSQIRGSTVWSKSSLCGTDLPHSLICFEDGCLLHWYLKMVGWVFLLFPVLFQLVTCSICCIFLGSTLTDCFSLSGNNKLHVIQRISKWEHCELQKRPVFSNTCSFNHNECDFIEACRIFLFCSLCQTKILNP